MNNKRQSVISLGVVSLVTVFAILLLTSFSILILSNSTSDSYLSQKTSKSVSDYYAAESSAEIVIANIDKIRQTNTFNDLFELKTLIENEGYKISSEIQFEDYNGVVVEFEQTVDDNKYIKIAVGFGIDKNEDVDRFIWQTVAIE